MPEKNESGMKEAMKMENKNLNIICADQSMRRPGFAQQHYNSTQRTVTVIRMSHVNNKFAKKPHGQMLSEIAHEFRTYLQAEPDAILVRERGFFKFAAETEVQCRVIGVTDLYAWATGNKVFEEIAPQSIKKTITGNSKASKEEVAAGLEKYVGKQDYACDDESDACAVGVTWLIQKGYIENKVEDG